MHGQLEQQHSTHLRYGNACWDGGCAHIVAMEMSADVAYI